MTAASDNTKLFGRVKMNPTIEFRRKSSLDIASRRSKMADEIQCDKYTFCPWEENDPDFTYYVIYTFPLLLVGSPPRTPGKGPGSISS